MNFIYEPTRIYAEDEEKKLLAEITFPVRDESRNDINHVYVDETLRGQGIAQLLMKEAYAYLKNENKKIVAKCPYAISWFKKNPDYQDIVINVKTKNQE